MSKEERKQIIERIEVDKNRLYGSIDDAIKYLTEMRTQYLGTDIGLEEHWTGYEDMDMVLCYTRDENDLEMSSRLATEAWEKKRAKEEERMRKDREKDLADYQRLKSRLGI